MNLAGLLGVSPEKPSVNFSEVSEIGRRKSDIDKKINSLPNELRKEYHKILQDNLNDRVWCKSKKIDYVNFDKKGQTPIAIEITYNNEFMSYLKNNQSYLKNSHPSIYQETLSRQNEALQE